MGQQQSKDELLYQQVNYGNIEGIKALRREGAGLEWIDKEGKTPLIVACMNPELISVAKTLIELGANVNAFRPGCHAGAPLHHAAKRGLGQTAKLLLSHGANAFMMNDDCQTPLDVARTKGYSNVVRTIESHISLFSGWLRELHGPGFLEALAPQLLSKKIWVVVSPYGSRNPSKPLRLEIAIYPSMQAALPRTVIALWKAKIEELKFHQPDPLLIIFDNQTKTRYKFASENEGDKQQLQSFYAACREPQVMHLPELPNVDSPTIPASAPPITSHGAGFGISSNACTEVPNKEANQGWSIPEAGSSSNTTQTMTLPDVGTASIPSAPPLPEGAVDKPIHYPSIDLSPVDLPIPTVESGQGAEGKDGDAASSCVICLDAPVEGACIPCGHMAGCMSCLNEIKSKKWGCPVCRAKINQVIRLYAV